MMRTPIQGPFTDGDQGVGADWTAAEDEALLRGIAAERSWPEIAAEISAELATRSAHACRMRFEHLREAVRS